MKDMLIAVGKILIGGVVAGATLGLAAVTLIAVLGGAFWLFGIMF